MNRGPSLALRTLLAVTLMILYIALAVGAVAGLAWLGKTLFEMLPSARGRAALGVFLTGAGCFAAVAIIAWSVLPRPDKFEPPGPEVDERAQPELFAEIRRIATATGEREPRHVYVMWDINAFVAQRGGVMGFGSRRVMGIGLPLVRVLTVSELRAVLAHEMGHFYGGDTRLGPWIYKTRGAIGRTIVNLARASAHVSGVSDVVHLIFVVVLAPFRWFGSAFLRITQAISRAQELGADRVAARCAGALPLANGLKKSHAATIAHRAYMNGEVLPLVEDGVLPPVGQGFATFVGTPPIAKLLDEVVDRELHDGEHDPLDSHPPLRERIAALAEVESSTEAADDRPAIALFRDADRLERELVTARLECEVKPIAWSDVPQQWTARWRKTADKLRPHVAGATIATIPSAIGELRAIATRVEGQIPAGVSDDDVRDWAVVMFGAAIAATLAAYGCAVETPVGAPVVLRLDALAVEPFVEVRTLVTGEVAREAWQQRWAERGLGDRAL